MKVGEIIYEGEFNIFWEVTEVSEQEVVPDFGNPYFATEMVAHSVSQPGHDSGERLKVTELSYDKGAGIDRESHSEYLVPIEKFIRGVEPPKTGIADLMLNQQEMRGLA